MTDVQSCAMSVVMLQLSLCLLSLITMTSSLSASDVIERMVASQILKMFREMKDRIATTPTTTRPTCELRKDVRNQEN